MKIKRDILLIGIILTVAVIGCVGLYLRKNMNTNDQLIAEITHNNKVVERIDLNKVQQSRTITIDGDYHNKIIVEKGRIRYEDSDCPNKYCVEAGWLTKYGDIAVCLPNKTIIDIEESK